MNQDREQAFKRLLADNSASTRWLDPVFDNREQRAWLNHYREFLLKVYSPADFAGVADASQQTPMALARIYVDEQFSEDDQTLRDVNIESGKRLDSEAGLTLEDLLIEFNPDHSPKTVNGKAVIVGAPGSGKSTLIKMLAVACSDPGRVAHARYLGRRLMIPLILRELNLNGVANTDQLLRRWAERVRQQSGGRYRIELDHLRFYLQRGWGIIAFDGVDEIGLKFRRRVRRLAFAFAERYPNCALLITGRPVGFEQMSFHRISSRMIERVLGLESNSSKPDSEQPPLQQARSGQIRFQGQTPKLILGITLRKYFVRPFTEPQIQRYIEQWYANRYPNDLAKQRLECRELQNSLAVQHNLASLKRRPIYLACLTYIHDVKGRLPNSQVLAYKTMVEAYLDVLDAAKRFDEQSHPEQVAKNFSAEDKTLVLEWLAHDLHCKKVGEPGDSQSPFHLRIAAIQFDEWLTRKLQNELACCAIKPGDASALRRYFIARSGLLVEPQEGVLSFSHLSFQEYLAGAWIFRQIGNHQFDLPPFLQSELLDRILDKAWHPVGIGFFGLQSRQQGGSFQQTLLEQKWLKEKRNPLAEFAFLQKLISEGEYTFSAGFLESLWVHYWQIACKSISGDWIEAFADVCQNAVFWFKLAEPWLTERFFELEPKDTDDIVLFSILPEEFLTALWKQAKSNGHLENLTRSMTEDLKWSLDCHALHPEIHSALVRYFSLSEILLLGESGWAIIPLVTLQEPGSIRDSYNLFLASDNLFSFGNSVDLAPNLVTDSTLFLARKQALNSHFDSAFARNRAWARTRVLMRSRNLISVRNLALNRYRAFDDFQNLDHNLTLDAHNRTPTWSSHLKSKKIKRFLIPWDDLVQPFSTNSKGSKNLLRDLTFNDIQNDISDRVWMTNWTQKETRYSDLAVVRNRTLQLIYDIDMVHDLFEPLNWFMRLYSHPAWALESIFPMKVINGWLYRYLTAQMTPIPLASPLQARRKMEILSEGFPDFKALFAEKWFPYEALKGAKHFFKPEPIEAQSHRLYFLLKKILVQTSKLMAYLPDRLSLKPGDLIRKWHGDQVAEQYLEDLKKAGWDPAEEPWPPLDPY